MLAIGVVAAALYWGILKPDAPSWIARTLGIGVWAGAFGLCALLLSLVSKATDLLRALAAMWRPLVLVLAAAYLLFTNDQGRELGVGLMAKNNWLRLCFLFLGAGLLGGKYLAFGAAWLAQRRGARRDSHSQGG